FELIESKVLRRSPNERYIFVCNFVEGTSNGGKIFDETAIESGKTKKMSQLLKGCGKRPSMNGLNLCIINLNPIGRDNKTQEDKFVGGKCALRKIGIKFFGAKNQQNLRHMSSMFFQRLAIN